MSNSTPHPQPLSPKRGEGSKAISARARALGSTIFTAAKLGKQLRMYAVAAEGRYLIKKKPGHWHLKVSSLGVMR
jgi:hypothetical protein